MKKSTLKKFKHNLKVRGPFMLGAVAIMLLVISPFVVAALTIGGIAKVAGLIAFGTDIVDRAKKQGFRADSHNHYGPFSRSIRKPRNPKSDAQKLQRNMLSSFAKMWQTGSIAKDAWNATAKNIAFKNRLGHLIHLTGEALFIKMNINALIAGGTSTITTPPADVVLPVLTDLSLSTEIGTPNLFTFECTLTPSTGLTNLVFVVEANTPGSQGIFFGSGYKKIGAYAAVSAAPVPAVTGFESVFGSMAGYSDKKVFMRVKIVDKVTGWASGYTPISSVIVFAP